MTDNLPALRAYCQDLAAGDMLPRQFRGNPANVMYAVEYADALGIPRINALTSIHVIDGKPTASADLIASLVRKAGHKLRVEGDDTYAEVTIIRADDPDYVPKPIRWDVARARQAGKWGSKGPWTNYPAAMLRSRAITEAARAWASDALYGVIYTAEELTETVDEHGNPVEPQSRVRQTTSQQVASERVSAQGSTRDAVANAIGAQAPAEAPAPTEDPEKLLAEAELAAGDTDALGALWKRAKGLPAEDVVPVRAAIEALAAAATAAASEAPAAAPTAEEATETVQQVLEAEVVSEEVAA